MNVHLNVVPAFNYHDQLYAALQFVKLQCKNLMKESSL